MTLSLPLRSLLRYTARRSMQTNAFNSTASTTASRRTMPQQAPMTPQSQAYSQSHAPQSTHAAAPNSSASQESLRIVFERAAQAPVGYTPTPKLRRRALVLSREQIILGVAKSNKSLDSL
jgi:hypothetical protein